MSLDTGENKAEKLKSMRAIGIPSTAEARTSRAQRGGNVEKLLLGYEIEFVSLHRQQEEVALSGHFNREALMLG